MAKKKIRKEKPAARRTSAGKSAKPRPLPQAARKARSVPEIPLAAIAGDGSFPVVGIGASAGGLEAFEDFFSHMPQDSGIAFILVPHLDPSHGSILPELLTRFTRMEVHQAQDGMKIQPDHVYVIPPNKDIAIFHRTLQLTVPDRTYRGIRMPIDFFLRSLADDQGEMAVCIILSGTGTDGSMGLRAIHAAGGMSMVQETSTAKYEGMPRSAIDTHLADYVLPVSMMPEQLMAYVKKISSKRIQPVSPAVEPSAIQKILMVLRSQTGHDFSFYKKSTVLRRIERRIAVHNLEEASLYLRYLQEHKEEVRLLFKELLITVTSFFRDPEAFEVLKSKIWPRMLEGKPEDASLRIWVPGCASGEEAYSIAMTLKEYMAEAKQDYKIQIFGTDIDEDAINQARSGRFQDNIGIDVSPARLKRFFTKEEGAYRVKKDIREMLVFAVQNAIKDAPFTKIDLISCRNFLIYVEPEMQNRLIPLFHYSLNPGGVLFLGSSESIGRFSDLFQPLHKKWKFFEAKGTVVSATLGALPWTYATEIHGFKEEEKKAKKPGIGELSQKALLGAFVPPSVVVDDRGNIIYFHGQTGNYLEPASGQASLNILNMAREGIVFELRTALHNAAARKKEIRYNDLKVRTSGGRRPVNLTIRPLTDTEGLSGFFLVSFQEPASKSTGEKPPKGKPASGKFERRVTELEQDLLHTKETLQTTVEEMQASNEELKSANEELQSTNEELQSTNEELETSKEELQSVNEELVTVNSELQAKIEQLSRTETDMKTLLDSIHIGALFLDRDLRIKRFTSEAMKLFNLIATDLGRPIRDIRSNLVGEEILREAQRVLDTLQNYEAQVQSRDGQWLFVRIMPTRSPENVIDGLVLTFTNITMIKQTQEGADQAEGDNRAAG
jgi:two-component system CheB/CheR fusion protein